MGTGKELNPNLRFIYDAMLLSYTYFRNLNHAINIWVVHVVRGGGEKRLAGYLCICLCLCICLFLRKIDIRGLLVLSILVPNITINNRRQLNLNILILVCFHTLTSKAVAPKNAINPWASAQGTQRLVQAGGGFERGFCV